MSAVITDLNPSITWGHSGDATTRYRAEDPRLLSDPFARGTLWERVADTSLRAGVGRVGGGTL